MNTKTGKGRTITEVTEHQVVVITTEEYIKNDLDNILGYLRREVDASVEIKGDAVKIVCEIGNKKFEGRALRKLLVREIKKAIKETLNIFWNQAYSYESAKAS